MRTIPLRINDKDILIQNKDESIRDYELRLAVEDIIKDQQFELYEEKQIDLGNICDLMCHIIYRGVITIYEKINGDEIPFSKMIFEVC